VAGTGCTEKPTSISLGRKLPKNIFCTMCPQRRARRNAKLANIWEKSQNVDEKVQDNGHQHTAATL
jgi:hypothetical protein